MKRLEMIEFGLVRGLEEGDLTQTEIVMLTRLLNYYFFLYVKFHYLLSMFRYLKSMLSELLEGFDFYNYLNLINFIIYIGFFIVSS